MFKHHLCSISFSWEYIEGGVFNKRKKPKGSSYAQLSLQKYKQHIFKLGFCSISPHFPSKIIIFIYFLRNNQLKEFALDFPSPFISK